MQFALEAVASGLGVGAIYALLALGFTFIFASSHVVNFAQGDWAMLAGMLTATVAASGLDIFWVALLAPVSGAVIGFLAYRLFLGWARSFDTMTVSLILLGVSLFSEGAAVLIWGPEPLGLNQLSALPPIRLGGVSLPATSAIVLVVTAVVFMVVFAFLSHTREGRATVAVAQNGEAAALCGINVKRVVMTSFVFSGVLAGIAGFLITPITSMYYQGGIPLTFYGFSAAAIGGLRNRSGAVIGGFSLGMIESVAGFYVGAGSLGEELTYVLPVLVLVVIGPRLQSSGTRSEEAMESFTADIATDAVNL